MLNFNLKTVFAFCLILGGCHLYLSYTLAIGMLLCLGSMGFYWHKSHKIAVADFIFAGSFLLNLWYITASGGNVRQYDYYNFYMHTDYFLRNNFFWEHPLNYLSSVYFQPPLWGLLSAVITKVCMWGGATQQVGFDTVRFLNLFFISGTSLLIWRWFEVFNFSFKSKIWMFALGCFLPINGIMANLVNNDSATYFLMTAISYCGYQWYLHQTWKKACLIGCLLLLSGMIKFSGLMIVPALGIWGIMLLCRKSSGQLWGQCAVIGLGAILGFAWGWFLLYFHFPIVPPPMDNIVQNMEGYSLGQRLFSVENISTPFAEIAVGKIEPNVWLSLLKTALFGEWAWQSTFAAYILYGVGLVIGLFTVRALCLIVTDKIGKDWGFNVFALVLFFSVLISWCGFWIEYPFFSSTEFRYVLIWIPLSIVCGCCYLDKKNLPKVMEYTLAGTIVLMISARIMLYLNTI